jgi:hypothetical protein
MTEQLQVSPKTRVGATPSSRGELKLELCIVEEVINWEFGGDWGGTRGNSSSMKTRSMSPISTF